MPVTYNTIETVEEFSIPYVSELWLGQNGCASRTVTLNAATPTQPPSSSTEWYEPISVSEYRPARPINGRRQGDPPFRYTPHYVYRTETRQYLLRRLNGNNGYTGWFQHGSIPKIGQTCTPTVSKIDQYGPGGFVWNEVTHQFVATEYVLNDFDSTEVSDAISTCQNAVSLEALTSYDILTDIAESREVPQMARGIFSDLNKVWNSMQKAASTRTLHRAARLTPRSLLKSAERDLRKIGEQWMRHRYGIMPLVYSAHDIMKTIRRGHDVSTKKTVVVRPHETGVTLPSATTKYLVTEYVGDIRIRASVFQHFEWKSMSLAAGLGWNPLVTLWELTPYSFVFDWFVNVGDYILRKTTNPMTRCHWASISQRSNYSKKTYAHFAKEDKTVTYANRLSTYWVGSTPPVAPSRVISRPEELQPYKEVVTNEYRRWLFRLNDARLTINPNLNWRRLMDGAVMSLNQLRKLSSFLNKRYR